MRPAARSQMNAGKEPALRPMSASAPRNSSKAPVARATGAVDVADRYQRVLEENQCLKKERNDLENKLKEIKTKFRRLTRDLVPDENGEYYLPNTAAHPASFSSPPSGAAGLAQGADDRKRASIVSSGGPVVSGSPSADAASEKARLEDRLRIANAQIEYMAREIEKMKHATPADAAATHITHQAQLLSHQLEAARQTQSIDAQRIGTLTRERDALHAEVRNLADRLRHAQEASVASAAAVNTSLTSAAASAAGDVHRAQIRELMQDLQKNRDQQLEDMHMIENLTRERDRLRIQVGLLEAQSGGSVAAAHQESGGGAAPLHDLGLHELQRALGEKASQLTVLNNRLGFSQTQIESLRTECDRLISELKQQNAQQSELKRAMFQLEHERNALSLRAEKASVLESSLQHKDSELMKSEQELLRLVDRMQHCSRDAEQQVRREMIDRVNELESLRDKADQDRRVSERELLQCRLETGELKRQFDNARHDAELYKREVQRLEAEKKELSDRVALAGTSAMATTMAGPEDEMQRAVALAAMRRRAIQRGELPSESGANGVLDMWEGMEWSDGKELAMLRETLAATAVDMELAETRCTQMQQSLNEKGAHIEAVCKERDVLLTENIEMRYRFSGVQTALARQQLQRLSLTQGDGSLVVTIQNITCDPIFQQCDDGSTFTPTLFFTLEGLEGYEPIVSDSFYALNASLMMRFVFDALDTSQYTVAKLQTMALTLQLHQSFGTESAIVAVATLAGSRLLHCRFDGVLEEHVELASLEGEVMGTVLLSVSAPDLLLPLIMARPLVSAVTPDKIRAALISFRTVTALRIQVFSADNLATSAAGMPPSPYIFYTATSPHGITFIADTTVRSSNREVTCCPKFDVLPTDHKVVLDAEFIRFLNDGTINFIVFDNAAADIRQNLGIASIALAELLASPTAVVQRTETLHPQGTITFGLSWVRALE